MSMSQDQTNETTRAQFTLWLQEHAWPDWPFGSDGKGAVSAQVVKELCEDAFHSGWHHGRAEQAG